MTLKLFLWLVASIAAGVLLLCVGYRGRRINRNPCCKQCGFDLDAHYPAASTCPECGAGIKLARFVVMGQRRRVWTLIAIGAPLAVLPLAPIGVVLFAAVTRTDLSKFKPLGLLLWEARSLAEPDVKAAGVFLHDRQLKGELTPSELDRVVQTALDLQSDRDRPFPAEWGEILDQARLDGTLTDAQVDQIRASAALPAFTCRPVVGAGGELPILCEAGPCRLPPTFDAELTYKLTGASISGEAAGIIRVSRSSPSDPWFSAASGTIASCTFHYSGSRSQNAMFSAGIAEQSGRLALRVPASLAQGPHAARLVFEVSSSDVPQYAATGRMKKPKVTKREVIVEVPFRIGAEDATAVTTLPADETTTKDLAQRLIPTHAQHYGTGGSKSLMVSFNIQGIQTPFAYKVKVVSGERSFHLGTLTNGKGGPGLESQYRFAGMNQTTLYSVSAEGLNPKNASLVLTPDPEFASRTVTMTQIYSGEVVIDHVAIQSDRYDRPSPPTSPATGFFFKLLGL